MINRRRTMIGNGKSGIYVMDASGKEIDTANATTDCIGVVVRDADKGVAFLIPKVTSADTRMKWNNDTSTVVPGVTTTNDSSVAEVDYKGKDNSDAMMEFDDYTSYAAGFCNSKTLTIGGMSKNGYLGSYGEWLLIKQNISEINSAFTAIGSDYSFQSPYWTSTLYSNDKAWSVLPDSSIIGTPVKNKTPYPYVRPFYDLR